MNIIHSRYAAARSLTVALHIGLAALYLSMLAACGGDTKTGGTGTGAVPAASELIGSGPLNAIGPAAIGSISFSDTAAATTINLDTARPASQLKLGMNTEVAGNILTGNLGTATRIVAQSAVIGPLQSSDVANQRLTVAAIPVQFNANTLFDGFPSVAALQPGDRIEVYGLPLPAAAGVLATRLHKLPADPGARVEVLANIAGAATNQITVQGLSIVTANAAVTAIGTPPNPSPPPPAPIISSNERVRAVGTFNAATNTLVADRLYAGLNPVRNDDAVLVLDGLVQSVTAIDRFRLNDTDVDASSVGGGRSVVGARVQVRGIKRAGVLIASEYRLIAPGERIEFTVQGAVANFASTAAFTVLDEAINAASAIYVGGTASQVANGRQVRVKGVAGPGYLAATEVTLLP